MGIYSEPGKFKRLREKYVGMGATNLIPSMTKWESFIFWLQALLDIILWMAIIIGVFALLPVVYGFFKI